MYIANWNLMINNETEKDNLDKILILSLYDFFLSISKHDSFNPFIKF